MKNIYLTIPLLTLALIATGCAADKTTTTTNEVVNTNTAAVNTNQPTETNTNVTATEEGGDVAEPATVTEEVDEYEGWQTYTNDEYGFSFKYPSDWEVKETREQDLPDDTLIFLGIRPRSMKEDSLYSFRITTTSIQKEIDSIQEMDDPSIQFDNIVETVIANTVARKLDVTNSHVGAVTSNYFIEINNKSYIIVGSHDEVFDAFLNSIEFK